MIAKFRKNKKKGLQRDIFFPLFMAILILAVVSFLGISNWRLSRKRAELNLQIGNLQEKISQLEARRQKLKSQISGADQQSFWERELRERGYKKPDEEVAVIVPAEEDDKREEEPSPNFLKQFLERLKFW